MVIRYSTSAYPDTVSSGTPVPNGSGGIFDAVPAAADSFIHESLTAGQTYYYSAFALDDDSNYSSGAEAQATALDAVSPVLAISVFQNPYLTRHLDVYVVSSEALMNDSVYCQVGSREPVMELVDSVNHVWMGDYELYETGVLSISASGEDMSGNPGETGRDFSSALILASGGGMVVSPDLGCELDIPAGAVGRDTYVLVSETTSEEGRTVYEISPPGLKLGSFFEIAVRYSPDQPDPEHLTMARFGKAGPVPVESYLDREAGRVLAYVEKLGAYGLVWNPQGETPVYGSGEFAVLQNVPNPFIGSTEIRFQIPRACRVTAEIVSIDGRRVAGLLDAYLPPGRHGVVWDGTDSGGRRIAGGVYFYRVSDGTRTVTKKMVHLR
jgi:hypothetical protein